MSCTDKVGFTGPVVGLGARIRHSHDDQRVVVMAKVRVRRGRTLDRRGSAGCFIGWSGLGLPLLRLCLSLQKALARPYYGFILRNSGEDCMCAGPCQVEVEPHGDVIRARCCAARGRVRFVSRPVEWSQAGHVTCGRRWSCDTTQFMWLVDFPRKHRA